MSGGTLDEVRRIAADLFDKDEDLLDADSSPEIVETWDSIQHLNLILAVEARYGIEFGPEEMDRMKTLGEIAGLVRTKIG
jgi:acyl carrier protein